MILHLETVHTVLLLRYWSSGSVWESGTFLFILLWTEGSAFTELHSLTFRTERPLVRISLNPHLGHQMLYSNSRIRPTLKTMLWLVLQAVPGTLRTLPVAAELEPLV